MSAPPANAPARRPRVDTRGPFSTMIAARRASRPEMSAPRNTPSPSKTSQSLSGRSPPASRPDSHSQAVRVLRRDRVQAGGDRRR